MPNEYIFVLQGNVHLLRHFSQIPSGFDLEVVNLDDDFNDTTTDLFYFKSWFCDGKDDHGAWEVGCELLTLLNGACFITRQSHFAVVIKEFWNGQQSAQVHDYEDELRLRDADVPSSGDIVRHVSEVSYDPVFNLIDLSKRRDDVYTLLKYFDMELNWLTLYKILEAIEFFADRGQIKLAVDQASRRRFTASANNFSVTRIHARHGPSNAAPPKNTMSRPDAYAFIRDLARAYLTSTSAL